jgi:hypothetical protein
LKSNAVPTTDGRISASITDPFGIQAGYELLRVPVATRIEKMDASAVVMTTSLSLTQFERDGLVDGCALGSSGTVRPQRVTTKDLQAWKPAE